MSATGSIIAKQRGRRAETPEQRLARAMRDVELAKEAVKETEKRRFAIIGEALWQEAQENVEFMAMVQEILPQRVVAKSARVEIAPLLAGGSNVTSVTAAGVSNGAVRED